MLQDENPSPPRVANPSDLTGTRSGDADIGLIRSRGTLQMASVMSAMETVALATKYCCLLRKDNEKRQQKRQQKRQKRGPKPPFYFSDTRSSIT